jgi:arginine deiminase
MWSVKSEHGRLKAVMVHSAGYSQWWKIPIPGTHQLSARISVKQTYPHDEAMAEHAKIIDYMREEGIKVFELNNVLTDIIEKASIEDKEEIINKVWDDEEKKPQAEELKATHLVDGFPPQPYYDDERDELVVSGKQRGSIYTRDISFMTPTGVIISKMKFEGRREQPKLAKIAFQYHSELREKVKILGDINQVEEEIDFNQPWIEGGDVLVVDEEMILCGVGQRSNLLGLKYSMEKIFENDPDETIKYIGAVRIPGPLPCGGHLDVFLNFPDERKALVMPYILDSSLVEDYPDRGLLTKLSDKLVTLPQLKTRLGKKISLANFENSGMCDIYRRDKNDKPEMISREQNVIDFLIDKDKIDPDGIILTGGVPEKKKDLEHLVRALQEGLREATNIVTIKPGTIITYDRNWSTNQNLKENGIRIKELPTTHLDMLGGPHCMTMPLKRDS